MDPARLRLFVAVLASPPVQAVVREAQATLRSGVGRGVRFGDPADAHVTLLFLGATPVAQVDALVAALAPVADAHAPFVLRTGGFGAFPSLGRARVAWLGLGGETDALERLHRSVVAALRPFGHAPDQERFTAHRPLGRVRDRVARDDERAVGALLRAAVAPTPVMWPVDDLCLMASETRAERPHYRALGRWPLTGPQT